LMGDNIPQLLFMAIGSQSIGAVSAGIYQTTLPDEIAQLINYMDVTVVFCDDQEQVDKLVDVRDQIPQVRKVIYEDPRGMRDYRSDDWYLFIDIDISGIYIKKMLSTVKRMCNGGKGLKSSPNFPL